MLVCPQKRTASCWISVISSNQRQGGGGGGTRWLLWRGLSCQAIFSDPQICWPNFRKPQKMMLTDSEFETPNNYFLALKISDPKYVNLPSILDPKYFFSVLKISDPKLNMFVFPKFQTPNMYMITPVIKVN